MPENGGEAMPTIRATSPHNLDSMLARSCAAGGEFLEFHTLLDIISESTLKAQFIYLF